MGMSQPPTHLLPEPALWIGEERVVDSSGGRTDHVYAATGQPTGQAIASASAAANAAANASANASANAPGHPPPAVRTPPPRAASSARPPAFVPGGVIRTNPF